MCKITSLRSRLGGLAIRVHSKNNYSVKTKLAGKVVYPAEFYELGIAALVVMGILLGNVAVLMLAVIVVVAFRDKLEW